MALEVEIFRMKDGMCEEINIQRLTNHGRIQASKLQP
jgi:hypothetical protein